MLVVGLVLAVLAAALHVFIFYLESVAWTTPRARAVFGTTEEQALATQQMALNQGYYNLFLAVVTLVGVVLVAASQRSPGVALVLAGTGSMVAAALVLALTDRTKVSAALKQGLLPALSIVCVLVGLAG